MIDFVFDGANRTIQVTADDADYVNNTLTFSAQDVYSAWKRWCVNDDGLQYPNAFDTIGGDPIDAVTEVGDYYFMRTDFGWRGIPPAKDNIIIMLNGNLYPRVVGDLVMEPLPEYTTTLIMKTSSLTQTVATGGTSITAQDVWTYGTRELTAASTSSLTQEQNDKLMGLDTDKIGYLPGEVYVNTTLTTNGNGSQGSPFNNINDGKDFAELNNIRNIVLTGDVVIPGNMKNMTIKGIGLPIIDLNGQDVKGSHFEEVQLKGTYIDKIIAKDSVLLEGLNLDGFFDKCALDGNLICPDLSKTLMSDCYSNIPGLSRPTISMNSGNTSELGVRGYHGGLTIKDCTNAGNNVTVEMAEGSLTFDNSNTDGVMVARGVCKFVNETAGASVTDETIAIPKLADGVWTHTTRTLTESTGLDETELHTALDNYANKDDYKADLTATNNLITTSKDDIKNRIATGETNIKDTIEDIQNGDWEIKDNQMIMRSIAGVEIARFNLYDLNGTPTMRAVFKRERV